MTGNAQRLISTHAPHTPHTHGIPSSAADVSGEGKKKNKKNKNKNKNKGVPAEKNDQEDGIEAADDEDVGEEFDAQRMDEEEKAQTFKETRDSRVKKSRPMDDQPAGYVAASAEGEGEGNEGFTAETLATFQAS